MKKSGKASTKMAQNLNQDVLSIFYFSDGPLTQNLQVLSQMDYYFDGLLTSFYKESSSKKEHSIKTLFFSGQFGHSVAFVHFKHFDEKEIDSVMQILSPLIKSNLNKVLTLGNIDVQQMKRLSQKYANLHFLECAL